MRIWLRLLSLVFLLGATGGAPVAAEPPPTPIDLNSANAAKIATLPGVSAKLAEAIVAWREKHGPFTDHEQLRKIPGVDEKTYSLIHDRVRLLPPLPASIGQEVVPLPTLTAVANYFVEFDGLDLTVLPAERRGEFLEKVNKEICACGCPGDTMARCYVNDPACGVAKARLQALYEQMKAAPAAPDAGP